MATIDITSGHHDLPFHTLKADVLPARGGDESVLLIEADHWTILLHLTPEEAARVAARILPPTP